MSSTPRPIPEGFHTLTVYLSAADASQAIDFYKLRLWRG